MKRLIALLALLPGIWACDAPAADYFAEVDGSLTFWRDCAWKIICPGNEYAGQSKGAGVRAGFMLPQGEPGAAAARQGFEIGYADLGSISGRKDYFLSPGCFILCAGATASWKNDATVAWVDWQGRMHPFGSIERGDVTGKIGVYSASITTTGNLGTGGPDYTRRLNSTGLMLGAAYLYPLTAHVALAVSADLFLDVKVASPIDTSGSLSELLVRLAAGVHYDF